MPKGRASNAFVGLGEYEAAGSSVGDVRQRFLETIRREVPQALEALRDVTTDDELNEWASRWSFSDGWLFDVARRTVHDWKCRPYLAKHLIWSDVILKGQSVPEPVTDAVPEPLTGEFVSEPLVLRWRPTAESEAEFRERVDPYIDQVREWAQRIGLTHTPEKRHLERDLSALALLHIKGDDLEAVADEYFEGDVNIDTARKAIAEVARLIEVTITFRK